MIAVISAITVGFRHRKNRFTSDKYKGLFRTAASLVLPQERIEKATKRILELEDVVDVSEIMDLVYN